MPGRGAVFDLWPAVAAPETCPLPSGAEAARFAANRLAELISPAFAHHLLAAFERRLGERLIDPVRVEKSLLLNRFTRRAQIDCARRLHDAGIPVVYIKGFANAHTLYEVADVRIAGDLDVLLDAKDLPRVVTLLEVVGFRFRTTVRAPWGFTATSSHVPFVSADGSCNLDLHTAPDSDPLDRVLSAGEVLEQSRSVEIAGMGLRVPHPDHFLTIALSNIVKDRFASPKQMIDLGRFAGRIQADWSRAMSILARAGLTKSARAALAMLSDLGFPEIPRRWAYCPTGWAGREYARALAEARALYPDADSQIGLLRREILLGGGWGAVRRQNLRRLAGLIRPAKGVPAPRI